MMRSSFRRSLWISLWLISGLLTGFEARGTEAQRASSDNDASPVAIEHYFVENVGQFNRSDIRYYLKTTNFEIGFAEGRVYFHTLSWKHIGDIAIDTDDRNEIAGGELFYLEVGNPFATPIATDTLSSYSNFFQGNDTTRWRTHVRHFNCIVYRDVYPGIDLIYYINEDNQLTYEYIVSPGADPSQIVLVYQAVKQIEQPGAGHIDILTAAGIMGNSQLFTYQNIDGTRREVASRFRPSGATSYGFELLDDYDPAFPLIIDPVISFATYWGSGGANSRSVSIDKASFIYISGGSSSLSWPTTPGAYDTIHSGTNWPDATVAKFDVNGNLVWSTLIGGQGEDYAYVSSVNDQGELYLAGRAGSGFPTTPGAFDRSFNGGSRNGTIHDATDCFVTKVSANGDRLEYSTFIGGSSNDNCRAIHLLPNDEVIVGGGNTNSPNLPVTPGAYKRQLGGAQDSWVAKVAADGSTLRWLTYFGPNNDRQPDETIRALGVDASGNVWIGGTTDGTDLVTTPDAFQRNRGGGSNEAYIAKLSGDGRNLVYLSWLGGSATEDIETEGVSDAAGNFYVAGSTRSSDFPVTPGAFRTNLSGPMDGYVAKINNDGSLGFATFYGGSYAGQYNNENFFGPVVDPQGNVYATGRFRSVDLPVTSDAYQGHKAGANDGSQDAVLAVFSGDGSALLYGTYFGGGGLDHGRHVAVHPGGDFVVIIGETNSTDLPLKGAVQASPSGTFLAKFTLPADPPTGTGREDGEQPDEFGLLQNYPNPFTTTTTISYRLLERSAVYLGIRNALGSPVATLVDGTQTPGTYSVTWNAAGAASGVYLYELRAGLHSEVKSMLLMR